MKKNERFFNKFGLYAISIIGVILGITLIAFSKNVPDVENTLNTIGQLMITVSLGSLFMEWFGYVNYTRKRMCEILVEDEVIKVLDINRKMELKSALIKNIYMYNAPMLQNEENNISTIIDNEMDNILRDYYFEEYIIYIDVAVIEYEGKKFIRKKFRHTFTAKTVNKDKTILESPINTFLEPPSDHLEVFELDKFIINGEKQDVSDWQVTVEENRDTMQQSYSKHYSFDNIIEQNKKKFTFHDKIDIDFEYHIYVAIDDIVYTYQIRKACKHFCIHYNAPMEYKILMEGFGFMSTGNSQRQRVVETETGCMLRFLDWILPGNGAIIVLQKR